MNENYNEARLTRKHKIAYMVLAIGMIAVTAVLVVMSVLYAMRDGELKSSKQALNSYYYEAMSELSDEVDETVLNLSKLTLSLSRGAVSGEITALSKHSCCAACALSRLPIDGEMTYSTMKLLNQITDFADSYGNALARGLDTESYIQSAAKFKDAAEVLQKRIDECLSLSMQKGEIDFSPLAPSLGEIADGGDVNEVEPDYPEMIYDGPFSDGRLPSDFKGLESMEEISEDEALYRFKQLLNASDAEIVGMGTQPETYEISGDNKYAALSVKGGMFLTLSIPMSVSGEETLGEEDAYMKAEEYAAKLGYGDLSPVWYYSEGGVAFINMTPMQDEAILYTDLVKVKISLSDGSLLGLEATGYCRNHMGRDIEPKISEATAAKLSGLDYDSVRLCVAPDRETEVVCYEVHVYSGGMEFYLYIDAVNGEKIKALKVVGNGGGKLTA